MPQTTKEYFKDALLQTTAGGSAGFVEVSIMHPLDLVKTRLQLQPSVKATLHSSQIHYNGIFDCFAKMYQTEGLKSFWKGILPPILAETPKRAIKFVTFEQYKLFFMFGSDKPTPLTFSLAGLSAGITESIFINPFETIKIKMQADRRIGKEVPSTMAVTKQIIRENGLGLNGLNKGLSATMARNGTFNMVYFGFYHSVKGYIKPLDEPLYEFVRKIFIGFLSGTLASCFNTPMDVAKSRIQIHYKGVSDCLKKMYQAEGLKSLWKGVTPPMLAETPKNAIKFVAFEQSKRLFMFGSDKPTPLTFSLAGLTAGIIESFFMNPFEMVKIRMQTERCLGKNIPSTMAITKQILSENGFGLKGLNKGLTATLVRNGVFNIIYFGFYHSVKDYFKTLEDPRSEFFRKVLIGFISGTIGSVCNIPFDVVKTRIQGPQPTPDKYKTTLGSIRTVVQEEGYLALYKGLLPKVMRLGPGCAILILVYEYSYDYLKKEFGEKRLL